MGGFGNINAYDSSGIKSNKQECNLDDFSSPAALLRGGGEIVETGSLSQSPLSLRRGERKAHITNRSSSDVDRIQKLCEASQNGDIALIIHLLDGVFDFDVNLTDANWKSPLHYACANGHMDCAKFLLEYGGRADDADSEGHTSLHIATINGNRALCSLLRKHNANPLMVNAAGDTPLDIAQRLRYGDDFLCHLYPDSFQVLELESARGPTNGSMLICQNSALLRANRALKSSAYDLTDIVDMDEETDMNILDAAGRTVLMHAAASGDVQLVGQLLRNIEHGGIFISEKSTSSQSSISDINQQDQDGMTALHWAARYGYSKVCELLLQSGASPHPREMVYFMSAEEIAVKYKHLDCAETIRECSHKSQRVLMLQRKRMARGGLLLSDMPNIYNSATDYGSSALATLHADINNIMETPIPRPPTDRYPTTSTPQNSIRSISSFQSCAHPPPVRPVHQHHVRRASGSSSSSISPTVDDRTNVISELSSSSFQLDQIDKLRINRKDKEDDGRIILNDASHLLSAKHVSASALLPRGSSLSSEEHSQNSQHKYGSSLMRRYYSDVDSTKVKNRILSRSNLDYETEVERLLSPSPDQFSDKMVSSLDGLRNYSDDHFNVIPSVPHSLGSSDNGANDDPSTLRNQRYLDDAWQHSNKQKTRNISEQYDNNSNTASLTQIGRISKTRNRATTLNGSDVPSNGHRKLCRSRSENSTCRRIRMSDVVFFRQHPSSMDSESKADFKMSENQQVIPKTR